METKVNVFWRGSGWYAPRAEGEGWSVINWYLVLPTEIDGEEVEIREVWDLARWQHLGTPRRFKREADVPDGWDVF